jgi:D-glycero-D-manno-heptose 1,7-bisphosphate phosphatase
MLRRASVTLGAAAPIAVPARWRDVRAIAFDADGTLRRTTVAGQPCPHAPDEWRLLPWLADGALTRLPWGDRLALGAASNQDHVGYGHLTERQARALLRSMLVEATGAIPAHDAVRLCPHVLEEPCACRKPGDAMLRALLARFDLAPDALLFVGDAATDAEAARRAGVRFAHVHDFTASLAAAQRDAGSIFVTASAA